MISSPLLSILSTTLKSTFLLSLALKYLIVICLLNHLEGVILIYNVLASNPQMTSLAQFLVRLVTLSLSGKEPMGGPRTSAHQNLKRECTWVISSIRIYRSEEFHFDDSRYSCFAFNEFEFEHVHNVMKGKEMQDVTICIPVRMH